MYQTPEQESQTPEVLTGRAHEVRDAVLYFESVAGAALESPAALDDVDQHLAEVDALTRQAVAQYREDNNV